MRKEERRRKIDLKTTVMYNILAALIMTHPHKRELRNALMVAKQERQKRNDCFVLMQDEVIAELVELNRMADAEFDNFIAILDRAIARE